jgi:hypothetical protein
MKEREDTRDTIDSRTDVKCYAERNGLFILYVTEDVWLRCEDAPVLREWE